jgi:hypothetical protein
MTELTVATGLEVGDLIQAKIKASNSYCTSSWSDYNTEGAVALGCPAQMPALDSNTETNYVTKDSITIRWSGV